MRPLRIAHQTLLISLGPALLITLMLTAFFTFERLKDLNSERETLGQLVADQLAPAAEYGLFSGNKVALDDLLAMTLRTKGVEKIEVFDPQRKAVAQATSHLGNHQLSYYTAEVVQQPPSQKGGLLDHQGRPQTLLGFVQVGMSVDSFNQRQQMILIKAGVLALFALLLTHWLAKRLAKSIAFPIAAMAKAMRDIKNGQYQIHLPQVPANELSDLHQHIHELAITLKDSSQEQQLVINALTQARIEAERANRAKSDFLAMMSHELRTPLNGVLGMLQLFETTKLSHEQAGYLTLASESTTHLLQVINDILDFSRTERGSLKLEAIAFSPKELTESVVEAFKPSAAERGLNLQLQIEPNFELSHAIGDPTRLRQILVNLVGNAIKFTDQGHIQVNLSAVTETENSRLVCQVSDTGIGIAPERLPKIFEAFEQADNSISRRYGGTGLGLAIAKNLAEHMQGTLKVSSILGQGSTFVLEIPLKAAHTSPEAPITAEPNNQTSACILLAEDNPINQVVIEAMLRSLGHEVVIVTDGNSAYDLIQQQHFDLVFMDCQLPVMNGYQATGRIRKLAKGQNLPIIALTASAMPGDKEACLAAGMSDYLAKPFKRADLQQILNTWLVQSPVETSQS